MPKQFELAFEESPASPMTHESASLSELTKQYKEIIGFSFNPDTLPPYVQNSDAGVVAFLTQAVAHPKDEKARLRMLALEEDQKERREQRH